MQPSHSTAPQPETAPDPFRDLNTVRPEKPLGYMTNDEVLVRSGGRHPEDVAADLQARGLHTLVTSAEEGSKVGQDGFAMTGGLYAYDEASLTGLLEANADVLADSEWPAEPTAFVRRLDQESVSQEKDPALYKLIAWAYDDQRPDLKRPEPVYDQEGKLIPPKVPQPAKTRRGIGSLAVWRRGR